MQMSAATKTLSEQMSDEVKAIFRQQWSTREGKKVPESADVQLGNDAVTLNATVLYADLTDSTGLVNSQSRYFAAEIYKTYLHCAAKIIRSEGGEITAYDGDRIMAVFIHETKNSAAARTALKLNYAVQVIISPALKNEYPDKDVGVRQSVGVDTSDLFVARTGVRGANDLVWVGPAANYAAKLCTLRTDDYSSWITAEVYKKLIDNVKTSSDGRAMWEARSWTAMGGKSIYRSNWKWPVR